MPLTPANAVNILLQHTGIFRRAGKEAAKAAVNAGTIAHELQGAVLFKQFAPVNRVYFLLSGKVQSDLDGLNTSELFTGSLGGASGVFIPNAKHSQTHTVASEEGADVLFINRDAFVKLIDDDKAFRNSIIVHFSNKNRKKNTILAQRFLPEAQKEVKVASKNPISGETTIKTVPVINVAVFDAKPYDIKYLQVAFAQLEKEKNSASPAPSFPVKKNVTFRLKFIKSKLNAETAVLASGCQSVCIFVNDTANAEVLQILKAIGIQMVLLRCAGFNNVDLDCAVAQQIAVARVPAYSPYAVAEHAAALLLSLNRNIHTAYMRVRTHNFTLRGLEGRDLNGLTCGVFGTGKIGQVFARIATGFGMKVVLWDKFPNQKFADSIGARYIEKMDDMFPLCDVISLHLPLTPQTKHLINAECIRDKLKPGVMLINTSRGPIVDAEALVEGLLSKKIGGAGLDVYENEKDFFFEDMSHTAIQDPILARLIGMPNVIITSHQAFFTDKALGSIAATTAFNAREYFVETKKPRQLLNTVLPEGYDPLPAVTKAKEAKDVKKSKL